MSKEKHSLPKIQDLETNPVEAFKYDQLKAITNHPPNQKWIKIHPMAKTPYLPIDKVEFLLDRIFQQWRVEIKNVQQLFNSVSCTIRLHYKDPVTQEWNYHDGIGAVGIQTNKGASASDMTAVKQDAVMKAAPAAKSYAIKDAAEHLGALFGRDLNRKETLPFTQTRTTDRLNELADLFKRHAHHLEFEDAEAIEDTIKNKEVANYDKMINALKQYENEQ